MSPWNTKPTVTLPCLVSSSHWLISAACWRRLTERAPRAAKALIPAQAVHHLARRGLPAQQAKASQSQAEQDNSAATLRNLPVRTLRRLRDRCCGKAEGDVPLQFTA